MGIGFAYGEAETGSLVITSDPSGAEVYLDGHYMGVTPMTLTGVGIHHLTLTKTEHGDYGTTISFSPGERETIDIWISAPEPELCAAHEPSFRSPGINVNPQNISFNMDSPLHQWERADICVYNPLNYHIEKAIIKLEIPDTMEYKVSTDLDSVFHYDPSTTTFTIEDFGDYNRSTQCDWFEFRPRIDTTSTKDTINLSYLIEYSHQITNEDENENGSSIKRAASFNISRLEKDSISRDNSISISIKNTFSIEESDKGIISGIIQDNLWLVAIASLFCSILLLILGPGSEQRIDAIKRKLKK